ncbi:protein CDV3 homolog [Scaptodrosophila lebanonensis]|uniref:Protein CDV3 homolog n=1 Tax=Drosophila lebanonensis TaxID=7225 RepID=A0A6J2TNZ3_DROLE|nr:protein CDV3 homolog [Scaptodrosophila lebanonensis]
MSSLDDFFAKKDKKKSKTKPNYLAADELYRTLEEATKVPEVNGKTRANDTQMSFSGSGTNSISTTTSDASTLEFKIRFSNDANDEEDEWCDFTEENRKHFTSVSRSGMMALTASGGAGGPATDNAGERQDGELSGDLAIDNSNNCMGNSASGGDGVLVGLEDASICPWQKLEITEQPSTVATVMPPPPSQAHSKPEVKKQVYVPPALRNSQGDCAAAASGKKKPPPSSLNQPMKPMTKLAKGEAPDLNSAEFFPSLSAAHSSKRAK